MLADELWCDAGDAPEMGGPVSVWDKYGLARDLGLGDHSGRGLVEYDQLTHAVMTSPQGPTSRCAAGAILRELPGRFDGSDPLGCPRCLQLLLADLGMPSQGGQHKPWQR